MKKNKQKEVKALIPNFNSPKELLKFLQQPTLALAEFLTGVLSSDLSDYKLSAGKLVQAAIRGRLLSQFGEEIKKYRDDGKIKEDYFTTRKSQATLLELLQFIDGDIPDEELLRGLKSIFLNMVAIDSDDKTEQVAYQLFQVCKKLNSMDILILRTCYKIYSGEDLANVNTGSNSYGDWEKTVAEKMGYDLPELIGAQDEKLVRLGLLSGRSYSDKSGVRTGKEYRLTKLGIKLCEYITGWDVK